MPFARCAASDQTARPTLISIRTWYSHQESRHTWPSIMMTWASTSSMKESTSTPWRGKRATR